MTRRIKVTIKDVAQAAGVSVTTVSDALAGKGRLPPETRHKVFETAKRLNYRPSSLARGLRGKGIGILGIVVTPAPAATLSTVWYWAMLATRFSETALAAGFAPMLLPHQVELLMTLPIDPDGLVVVDPEEHDAVLVHARGIGLPLITVGRDIGGTNGYWVDNGTVDGIYELLVATVRPRERLLVVTIGPHKSYVHDTLEGVRRWARANNTQFLTHWGRDLEPAAMEELKAGLSRDRPDVILAQNDRVALAVLACLRDRQLGVPSELRLLSAADAPALEHSQPSITALRESPAIVGELAAKSLIDLVHGIAVPSQQIVPTQPVFRESALDLRA